MRVTSFFYKYSVLSQCQFGFQARKSCCDAVSSLIERIYTALNDKMYVFAVFIDLKKAYDADTHSIPSRKLEHYGIRGIAADWFSSF